MNDKNDIENKTIKTKYLWKDFSDSPEYKGLKSRRDNSEYGRDEYYEWLKSNFEVTIKNKIDKINVIISVTKKYIDEDIDDILIY